MISNNRTYNVEFGNFGWKKIQGRRWKCSTWKCGTKNARVEYAGPTSMDRQPTHTTCRLRCIYSFNGEWDCVSDFVGYWFASSFLHIYLWLLILCRSSLTCLQFHILQFVLSRHGFQFSLVFFSLLESIFFSSVRPLCSSSFCICLFQLVSTCVRRAVILYVPRKKRSK